MMTPCSQKISAAKKKRFDKCVTFRFRNRSSETNNCYHSRGAKPMQQLAMQIVENSESDEENIKPAQDAKVDSDDEMSPVVEHAVAPTSVTDMKMDDPENPF